jgi:hypothetical protein
MRMLNKIFESPSLKQAHAWESATCKQAVGMRTHNVRMKNTKMERSGHNTGMHLHAPCIELCRYMGSL